MSHLQRVMDVRWARKREKQGESREADPAFSVCECYVTVPGHGRILSKIARKIR